MATRTPKQIAREIADAIRKDRQKQMKAGRRSLTPKVAYPIKLQ